MPRGRELLLHESVQRFAKEMERVKREVEKEWAEKWIKPKNFTHTALLERMMDQFQTLAVVVNESRSRSEVIKHAALVADTARLIAEIEHTDARDTNSDLRWLPQEF